MSCGGSAKKKMANGGSTTNKLNNARGYAKPQTGGSNPEKQIYGIPNAGPTGNNLSGTYSYKNGGATAKAKFGATTPVKASCKKGEVRSASGGCVSQRPKFQNGGSTKPALSKAPAKIKTGLNSKDQMTVKNISKIIKGGKKYQNGGATKSAAKPKPKYVYGDAPGIGGPAAGQAATPGETLMMDEKLAAERKAKAAAAKRKAQATKKGR
jgi:hypothetical protein